MNKFKKNYWFFLLPFLFLYTFIVLKFYAEKLDGDESRYLMYANNLLNGFYSPKSEIFLWNGPGYPILLIPFVFFQLPLIFIALFNAILAYLSLIMFYTYNLHEK